MFFHIPNSFVALDYPVRANLKIYNLMDHVTYSIQSIFKLFESLFKQSHHRLTMSGQQCRTKARTVYSLPQTG
jgi:hypothetical protein